MNFDSNAPAKDPTERTKTLARLLGGSERVMVLVDDCAREMSYVNSALKAVFENRSQVSALARALERGEAIERRLREASEVLAGAHGVLESDNRERVLVEHQLAAAIEQEEGAQHAALHDVLTGLPNRALFKDRLEHGIEQARRHGRALAVMFIDLDKFKEINDSYGHQTGDEVLRIIAKRLTDNTRSGDTVCRNGGDEFLYLLAETHDQVDLERIAGKIINAIQVPCEVSMDSRGTFLAVGASIGIAVFPRHGLTGETLLKRADEAMYRAKLDQSGYSMAR